MIAHWPAVLRTSGTRARRGARLLRETPMIPLAIIGALILGAIFAPLLAPYDPVKIDLTSALKPPFFQEGGSTAHLLGTDKLGRDILSRLIYGGRISLVVAGAVILVGGGVGTFLGLISGYSARRLDAMIQRGVEAVLSLPTIMVALVFVYVVGQSLISVILVLSPFIAARFTRMVRGDVLRIREHNYVALARVAGASDARIIFRHILPNVASTIIVIATLEIGAVILVEASLSFLGVGVPAPTPAWGLMIADGREYLSTKYWMSLFPGLAIMATVLSINWIGDWLRDILDPKRQFV